MSSFQVSARVDSKGRLLLPRRVRDTLELKAGDTLFLRYESKSGIVRLAKVRNPFDVLVEEAEREYEAGETVNIRDHAKKPGFRRDE
jgi:AbrB family looped-hinge helix DNA binding protein